MNYKKTILAICGSTRKSSSNLNLIRSIALNYGHDFELVIFEGLAKIPHFNPDLDRQEAPSSVSLFRNAIKDADAVLICTPEYAAGVPGTLKNAIDWTVSSMEFSGKPVLLVTASTSGQHAHQSLLSTLLVIEARITEQTQFVISSVRSKVNDQYEITDQQAGDKISLGLSTLLKVIADQDCKLSYLPPPLMN